MYDYTDTWTGLYTAAPNLIHFYLCTIANNTIFLNINRQCRTSHCFNIKTGFSSFLSVQHIQTSVKTAEFIVFKRSTYINRIEYKLYNLWPALFDSFTSAKHARQSNIISVGRMPGTQERGAKSNWNGFVRVIRVCDRALTVRRQIHKFD